jgi:glutamine amidotransferase
MSRLIAYLGNDASRTACALWRARSLLRVPLEEPIDSSGIGYLQGEILLQRRPKPPHEPIDFYDIVRQIRTDAFIAHARVGTVGRAKHENTHPFRFRQWLFAHHGTVPNHAALRGEVPDFLRRNLRGETDSEVLFYLLMSELHKTNRIDDPLLTPSQLRDATAATLRRVDGATESSIVATNGRLLVISRLGSPVRFQRIGPIIDCPVCKDASPATARPRRVDHEHLRAFLALAAAPTPPPETGDWRELPDRHLATVTTAFNIEEAAY